MSSVDREQPREHIGELLLVRPVMHHPEHIELLCEAPRQGWQERGDEAAHVIGAAGHASMLVVVGHDVVVTGPGIKERAPTGTMGGAGAMGLSPRTASTIVHGFP